MDTSTHWERRVEDGKTTYHRAGMVISRQKPTSGSTYTVWEAHHDDEHIHNEEDITKP